MGCPKAWLPFGDEMLLPRVVRLLGLAVEPVVVVAGADQEVPPVPDRVQVVRDVAQGRGPLQGLAAGLVALRGRAEGAYVSSCDVPFLRPAFVRRMIDLLGDSTSCVLRVDGRFHPLAAVYRLDVLPTVTRLLAEGRLRTSSLCETVPARVVQAAELADVDPDLLTLRNLNTPEEYADALRVLAGQGVKGP